MLTLTPLIVEAQPTANVSRPNIVLVLMDNFGSGELGIYGVVVLRDAAMPRIDKLALEGMRLFFLQALSWL